MKKIEAIIQPFRLQEVQTALIELGIDGITVTDVHGHGRQRGHTTVYRGQEYSVDLFPKTKLEIVVNEQDAEEVVRAICRAARTGAIGDGKIFIYGVEGAIRIRNSQMNEAAL